MMPNADGDDSRRYLEIDRAIERDIQLPAILAGACLIGFISVTLVAFVIVPAIEWLRGALS